jgi:hypothetical protein
MEAYGGVDVYIHVFLTLARVGGEWLASRPGRFPPGEGAPGTHWIGGWVGRKVDLDAVIARQIKPRLLPFIFFQVSYSLPPYYLLLCSLICLCVILFLFS